MRALHNFSKPIRNSRGMLSAEFLFSLILCAGLCMLLFAINFSLSMAEVAQYVAFSTARAHAAAQYDQDTQTQKAKDKFAELMNRGAIKPLFNNPDSGWFALTNLDIRGGGANGKTFNNDYPYTENRVPQIGVRLTFVTKVLKMKIPFLGTTTNETTSEGFSARVTGLIFREPTQKECQELQVKVRYSAILELDSRYKTLGDAGASKYVPLEDNGC